MHHYISTSRARALASTLALLALSACGPEQKPSAASEPSAGASSSGGEASASAENAPGASAAAPGEPTASPNNSEFALNSREVPKNTAAKDPNSKIKPTRTEAALKFTVIDKNKGPIGGLVISLTGPSGKFFTEETNPEGYTEILVPVGQKYDLMYLSLGTEGVAASVNVTDEPNQSVKLTLRYKRERPEPSAPEPHFVLDGVQFATGKAVINPESYPRLDAVVEYMTYKKSARIEISGHTDNQGNPKANKALSEKRAQACRDYLIKKGIDGSRIEAHGFGDERPIAPNDTEVGRQQNRRIEASEL